MGSRSSVEAEDPANASALLAAAMTTEVAGPEGSLRVSQWTGEFVEPADEEAYRLASVRESHGRMQTIAVGIVLLAVTFSVVDHAVADASTFLEVLALRLVSAVPPVVIALRAPPASPWGISRWAAAAALFYVVLMVAISMLLPPRPIALTIWTAFILMIYLLPPLRMRAAVANGALVTIAVFTIVPLPWPIDHPETLRALVMMVGVNVLGVLTLRSLERGRRAEFALLSRTLPKSVIPRLRRGERVVDHVESASILFADLVGFSSRSATMKTTDVIEMLEELFAALDELAARRGAEKIKTIGDCYMAAAGIPDPRPDHAQVLAHLALDMIAMVQSRTFAGHELRLRIGLHCGPVAAGIIGHDRFLYDVWGETVNTAQRMESSGAPNAIVVTPAFAVAIADDFELTEYGTVNLKDGSICAAFQLLSERVAGDSDSGAA